MKRPNFPNGNLPNKFNRTSQTQNTKTTKHQTIFFFRLSCCNLLHCIASRPAIKPKQIKKDVAGFTIARVQQACHHLVHQARSRKVLREQTFKTGANNWFRTINTQYLKNATISVTKNTQEIIATVSCKNQERTVTVRNVNNFLNRKTLSTNSINNSEIYCVDG